MSRQRLGDYVGRPVWLIEPESTDDLNRGLSSCVSFFWLPSETMELEDIADITKIIVRATPLAAYVCGPVSERIFDSLLESSGANSPHIMSRYSTEKLEDTLEEFFASTWPSEDRFDQWEEYAVVAFGQAQAEILASKAIQVLEKF